MNKALRRFLPKYFYALLRLPWLFSLGTLSARHRFLVFQIAKHFGMQMPVEKEELPVTSLAKILPTEIQLMLLELQVEGGNVNMLELMVIAQLAKQANPPMAFEIGTFDGRTTVNIAANFPDNGRVYTLDLPRTDLGGTKFALAPGESEFVDKAESGAKFLNTPYASKISQLYGDSATFDFSTYENKMGLVFVDGSHAYDYVVHDTSTALRLAATGGVILWHDYQQDWPGVIRALNEARRDNPACASLSRVEGTSLVILKR